MDEIDLSLPKPIVHYKRSKVFNVRLCETDEPTIKEMLAAMTPLYMIAETLHVDRHHLSTYIKEHMPECLTSRDEKALDIAEDKLLENIKGRNENAIEFFLDRKGRKRGYGEHIMTEDVSELPKIAIGKITINVDKAKKPETKPIDV